MSFDAGAIRAQFPALHQLVRGDQPLVYLDNAATTQKPLAVIEALDQYYRRHNANVHRGVHALSEQATLAYEGARRSVQRFVNARSEREIVFTSGTTEAINLVAHSFGGARVREGDRIVVTHMEHHSNIVPWQLLCARVGATLDVAPITDDGELVMSALDALIGPRTRLVAAVHASNALGTVNPVKDIVRLAHDRGVPVLLDGAQAVPHLPVDVVDLDVDFYAFSGHKVYGPTGIGALYGKAALLAEMPPWQGGGDMIRSVSFAGTTYADPPARFEAGTPPIAAAIGLGVALDWLTALDLEAVAAWERELLGYATAQLSEIPGLRLVGTARDKVGVLGFTLEGVHPHDIGTILDMKGVAVRAGHHCAQPVMERLGVVATTRASLAVYNTRADVDRLVDGLRDVVEMFR